MNAQCLHSPWTAVKNGDEPQSPHQSRSLSQRVSVQIVVNRPQLYFLRPQLASYENVFLSYDGLLFLMLYYLHD